MHHGSGAFIALLAGVYVLYQPRVCPFRERSSLQALPYSKPLFCAARVQCQRRLPRGPTGNAHRDRRDEGVGRARNEQNLDSVRAQPGGLTRIRPSRARLRVTLSRLSLLPLPQAMGRGDGGGVKQAFASLS
jgi:hypothetical protein